MNLDELIGEHLGADRVLLTGGGGFLGSFLRERLEGKVAALATPRSWEYDLRDETAVRRLFETFRPTLVLHAAVHLRGIGYMAQRPAEIFDDNVRMNFFVQEASRRFGVRKFVGIGTICSYPKFAEVPFREEHLWDGLPEEVLGPYGLAKKFLLVQTQTYAKQYGFNGIHLLLGNIYGPRDHFSEEWGHVIPALIARFGEAVRIGKSEVVCWGDGSPTRDFLYVEDAVEGVLRATALYDSPEPVNIGAGEETSMKELAELIAELTGFRGRIVWDTRRPQGQPRRRLDTSKAAERFGFRASTPLREGLKRTIAWYRDEYLPSR